MAKQYILQELDNVNSQLAQIATKLCRPEFFKSDNDTTWTKAIQECLNTYGTCYLEGTYEVDSPIIMPSNGVLCGSGRGSATIQYIGALSANYLIIIPYTSYFCSIHDLTLKCENKINGIYDCYEKPEGTYVGLRTQLYNLHLYKYTDYGMYLNAMGSEIYNCLIDGNLSRSKYGMYIEGTDQRISNCRILENAEYGIYCNTGSNFISNTKVCVNKKGAYFKGGSFDIDIEAQENYNNGVELNECYRSNISINCSVNGYVDAGCYGVSLTKTNYCNIKIAGHLHVTIGGGNTGGEKALVLLNPDSTYNNISVGVWEATTNKVPFIDGISVANNIILNGSNYDNIGILTSNGYELLNYDCAVRVASGASSVELTDENDYIIFSLIAPSGANNIAIISKSGDAFSTYNKLVIICEYGEKNQWSNIRYTDTIKINNPIARDSSYALIEPTTTYVRDYVYTVAIYDNPSNVTDIMVRTSSTNSSTRTKGKMHVQIFGLKSV